MYEQSAEPILLSGGRIFYFCYSKFIFYMFYIQYMKIQNRNYQLRYNTTQIQRAPRFTGFKPMNFDALFDEAGVEHDGGGCSA